VSDLDTAPVLFLDIDGVLNSTRWAQARYEQGYRDGYSKFDPEAVTELQRIVQATDCQIVLSSTWRLLYSLAEIRGRLSDAGFPRAPVVDKTPRGDGIRGEEVRRWREALGHSGPYACLDDDSDFFPYQPLVKTSHATGLTKAEADRCIALLRASDMSSPPPTSEVGHMAGKGGQS
jgi:hypothetical protein